MFFFFPPPTFFPVCFKFYRFGSVCVHFCLWSACAPVLRARVCPSRCSCLGVRMSPPPSRSLCPSLQFVAELRRAQPQSWHGALPGRIEPAPAAAVRLPEKAAAEAVRGVPKHLWVCRTAALRPPFYTERSAGTLLLRFPSMKT